MTVAVTVVIAARVARAVAVAVMGAIAAAAVIAVAAAIAKLEMLGALHLVSIARRARPRSLNVGIRRLNSAPMLVIRQ